ncbi:thiamine pyrophosphokinase [Ketogulonicigenium robustum]|uniref:Thiamine pyrophosphokinase n=1 Tax=Ketogulonicigenium robustum TaxID=92947 RepID=A0A1W6NXE6_9RHOB|nr:thiamine pyrophosphokinase [Ketogulonicigenium robustum]
MVQAARDFTAALVAVDGGADACLRMGLTPDAVVGDLDSLSDNAAARFTGRLHRIEEQITTDFEKALRWTEAPLRLAVGFWGGRADHTLAVLGALGGNPAQRCIVLTDESIIFHCPPTLDFDLPAGTPVSLFPLAVMGCDSTGLVWPTAGLVFDSLGRTGVSNSAAGGRITLRPARAGMLVILPLSCLPAAVRALR